MRVLYPISVPGPEENFSLRYQDKIQGSSFVGDGKINTIVSINSSLAMKFLSLRPMLWTNKFEESIDFYVNTLGFSCGEKNEEWGWAALQKGETEIMLAKPNL